MRHGLGRHHPVPSRQRRAGTIPAARSGGKGPERRTLQPWPDASGPNRQPEWCQSGTSHLPGTQRLGRKGWPPIPESP